MLKIDKFLYNKLIKAYLELKPYKYTYYKLINTLTNFINNL
jgi:hypothetical protein